MPNGFKSTVLVPRDDAERADYYLNIVHDHKFSIKTGSRHLGSFVGDKTLRDEYISSKVGNWVYGVEKFAIVATKNQPHADFTGFPKSL